MATNNSINSMILGASTNTAFGQLSVAEPTNIIQLQFPYNINSRYCTTSVTGSGTATQANSMLVLQTGAAASSSATMTSKYYLHYQAGQGACGLFTAIYTTGVANSTQIAGIGDSVDGFFFGYNGTLFGILHRNNSVDTWISQANWNVDKANGTTQSGINLDPTKGNVYKVQFQWLGFGNINFFIENKNDGSLTLVHTIQYANSNTVPSLSNPTLPMMSQVINTTNATNLTMKHGSFSAYIEGLVSNIDERNNIGFNKTVNTRTNILTLKNVTTYQSKSNKVIMYPDFISIYNSSGANTDGLFTLILNTTLGGSPSYTNIDANTSVASYDTAGTTTTGGIQIFQFYLSGGNSISYSLANLS